MVPALRDSRRFTPIFVLATAQSYSSVATSMIGQHPELVGLPELKLFCCGTIGELEESLPVFWRERGVVHRSPGLLRAVAELEFGEQTGPSIVAAGRWLRERRTWSGADVLDCLLERVTPRTAVEKSPDNVLNDSSLERMMAAYPRARYLHLTRHPVSNQRSMQQHLLRALHTGRVPGDPMSGIGQWYDVHRRILRFASGLPPEQYLRVKAEDILNDPRAQLPAVARWLQIRSDDEAVEAMRHPERSPFARPGPEESGASGGNNQAFLNSPVPHRVEIPANLEPPPGWTAEPRVWDLVLDLARRLGYSGEAARAST